MTADETESVQHMRREVMAALDQIVDPCSQAIGKPVGLVGMGMIEKLDISGDAVTVVILPTYPACLFQGMFEDQIDQRLRALSWCSTVKVSVAHGNVSWNESRMTAAARSKLGRQLSPAKASADGS